MQSNCVTNFLTEVLGKMEYESDVSLSSHDSEFEFPTDFPDEYSIGDLTAHLSKVEQDNKAGISNYNKEITAKPKKLVSNYKLPLEYINYYHEFIINSQLRKTTLAYFDNVEPSIKKNDNDNCSSIPVTKNNLQIKFPCRKNHRYRLNHSSSCISNHNYEKCTFSKTLDDCSQVCNMPHDSQASSCMNLRKSHYLSDNPSPKQYSSVTSPEHISVDLYNKAMKRITNQNLICEKFDSEIISNSTRPKNSDIDDFGAFETFSCNTLLENQKKNSQSCVESKFCSIEENEDTFVNDSCKLKFSEEIKDIFLGHTIHALTTVFEVDPDSKLVDFVYNTEQWILPCRSFEPFEPSDYRSSSLWNIPTDKPDAEIFNFSWKQTYTCLQYMQSIGIDLYNPLIKPTTAHSATQVLLGNRLTCSLRANRQVNFALITAQTSSSACQTGEINFSVHPTNPTDQSPAIAQVPVLENFSQLSKNSLKKTDVVDRVLALLPNYSYMLKSTTEFPFLIRSPL